MEREDDGDNEEAESDEDYENDEDYRSDLDGKDREDDQGGVNQQRSTKPRHNPTADALHASTGMLDGQWLFLTRQTR
jgi:hypothetical protein